MITEKTVLLATVASEVDLQGELALKIERMQAEISERPARAEEFTRYRHGSGWADWRWAKCPDAIEALHGLLQESEDRVTAYEAEIATLP